MNTINVILPDDIVAAISAEALKHNTSVETVASVLLVSEVTHTLRTKNSAPSTVE